MKFWGIIAFAVYCVTASASDLPKLNFVDLSGCQKDPYFSPSCSWYPSIKLEPWTDANVSAVKTALAAAQQPKAAAFIALLRQLGLEEIQFVYMANGPGQASTLMVSSNVAQIALSPVYFQSGAKFGDVSEQTHVLLHELVHVYADKVLGTDYFLQPFWKQLSVALEWHNPTSWNPMVSGSSAPGKLSNAARTAGQWDKAIAIDLGFARPLGFPSIYSMSRTSEYLAELASFLMHDPSVQSALPYSVIEALKSSQLAFLLDPASAPLPANDPARGVNGDPRMEFVGMLFSEERFVCTVFILKHGVVGTAKHCLDDSWGLGKPASAAVHYGFLSLEFQKADGTRVRVDGYSITGAFKDSGKNDLAYLIYDPKDTTGKVNLPVIHFMTDKAEYGKTGTALFSVQYPLPAKVQTLKRLETKSCAWTGEVHEMKDSRFQGVLHGTTCPGWYGASGSPLLSEASAPGELNLWGVLSDTFSSERTNIPAAPQNDSWGPYTDTNFSPVYLGDEFTAEK